MDNMLIKELMMSSGYWVLNKNLVSALGLETSFVLVNLSEAESMMADDDGWFYQTGKTLQDISGLTRHKQDKALKELKNLGIIEQRNSGIPMKRYFKINYNAIKSTVFKKSANLVDENKQTSVEKISKLDCKKSATNKESIINNIDKQHNIKSTAVAVSPVKQILKRYREFVIKALPDINIPVLDSQIMKLKKHIDENLFIELEKSSYLQGKGKSKPGIHLFTLVKNINDIKLGAYRDKKIKDLPVKSDFKDNITDDKMKEWGLM